MFLKYRLLVCVQYVGARYIGWQKQNLKNKKTIQGVIEKVLFKIIGCSVDVYCASRTDSGVNSIGQIFHFDTNKYMKESDWLKICNFNLPNDICFKYIRYVSLNFHARYKAIYRRYLYIIMNGNEKSVWFNNFSYFYNKFLNVSDMIESSRVLLGEHDFSFFKSKCCQSISKYRFINFLMIYKKKDFLFFDIKANSFLHNMVRNIVSTLLLVGDGSLSKSKFIYYFRNKIKYNFNYIIAPPHGLYLYKIYYNYI